MCFSFPPTLTMMHLCITQCMYWMPQVPLLMEAKLCLMENMWPFIEGWIPAEALLFLSGITTSWNTCWSNIRFYSKMRMCSNQPGFSQWPYTLWLLSKHLSALVAKQHLSASVAKQPLSTSVAKQHLSASVCQYTNFLLCHLHLVQPFYIQILTHEQIGKRSPNAHSQLGLNTIM